VTPALGFSAKLWYGVGQAAEGMKNAAFGTFLLLFYSQVLGLNPAWAGFALLIALVFDAITDPLIGSVSDSWAGRWGRRHGFMYAAAVPMAVTFYFAFSPPDGLDQAGLFGWMLVWTVLARAAMTLYHVPHLALGAELTPDYAERSRVVAYRVFFGFFGAGLLFAIARFVFMRPSEAFSNGQLDPAAYPPLGVWFGLAMGVLIFLSAIGTHSRIPYLPKPSDGHAEFSLERLAREMNEALHNASFRVFFFGLLLFFVARGVDGALGIYMGTYFWLLGSDAVLLPVMGLFGVLPGTVFWGRMARSLEKKPMFMIGITGFSAIASGLPIAALLGLFPARESAAYLPLIYGMTFLGSFFGAAGLVSAGSMLADISDEHELDTGRRQEGIFFGALSFSGKASAGIGNWLGGVALWLIAFPTQARPGEVDPWTVVKLALVYGPGVVALVVAAIVMLSRYHLTRERHREIQVALEARRRTRTRTDADAQGAIPEAQTARTA
jgi:GPH family glycoside/pentoside/hexuronide:cation symporter